MKKIILLAIFLVSISGCATYKAPSYTPTKSNIESITGSDAHFFVKARSPDFEDTGSIMCRAAGPVETPGKITFTSYIQRALENELRAADLWDDKGKPIVVDLKRVDFSSSLGATNWYIDGTYSVFGESVSIATAYNDRSSYFGNKACNNMALYFPKAVAEHLAQLYQSAAFVNALGTHRSQQDAQDKTLSEDLRQLETARAKGLITEDEYTSKKKSILDNL